MAARATEDVPVTAVMIIFNTGPHAFYATADSGIASITDVKGKTIATSPTCRIAGSTGAAGSRGHPVPPRHP